MAAVATVRRSRWSTSPATHRKASHSNASRLCCLATNRHSSPPSSLSRLPKDDPFKWYSLLPMNTHGLRQASCQFCARIRKRRSGKFQNARRPAMIIAGHFDNP